MTKTELSMILDHKDTKINLPYLKNVLRQLRQDTLVESLMLFNHNDLVASEYARGSSVAYQVAHELVCHLNVAEIVQEIFRSFTDLIDTIDFASDFQEYTVRKDLTRLFASYTESLKIASKKEGQ